MRAIRCIQHAPVERLAEVIRIEEVPEPAPGTGEVAVAVAAAAVNFTDVLFIADRYQVSLPVPFTPGSEFAGTVRALGPGVSGLSPGDRVAGRIMHGAFAEQVVVPASAVRRLPEGADLRDAAATGLAYATAYSALRTAATVTKGEWVAVTGASGGVGSAAVAVARSMGARVVGIVSTTEKAAYCRALGADAVVDLSGADDVRRAVREATGEGVDVVIDVVGGALAEPLLRSMRPHGRFVTVGFASGEIPRIPLNLVLLKRVVVRGFEIREFARYEPAEAERDARELAELLARGVDAHVSAVYPLDRAADALGAVGRRAAVGKIVLAVDAEACARGQ